MILQNCDKQFWNWYSLQIGFFSSSQHVTDSLQMLFKHIILKLLYKATLLLESVEVVELDELDGPEELEELVGKSCFSSSHKGSSLVSLEYSMQSNIAMGLHGRK